jgi:hypothetical protein
LALGAREGPIDEGHRVTALRAEHAPTTLPTGAFVNSAGRCG